MSSKKQPIYLDYAATTPIDPRVLEAMIPYFKEEWGNAASRTHPYGWRADEAVKQARKQVAALIQAQPEELVFTSGATEAINMALKGYYEANFEKGNHIITVCTEHKAVLDTCAYLETQGAEVTYLPVQEDGLIDLEVLKAAFTDQTILVCVMYANNETGVIQSIQEIASLTHDHDAIFMTDATQAIGKITVDVVEDGIDLMSMSAHKLYGPKGVGALYVKRQYPKLQLTPLLHGGGHEKGYRSGTLNVPGIIGFGEAAAICKKEMAEESVRIKALRDELETGLLQIEGVRINGHVERRLPNICNMAFEGVDAEAFVIKMQDLIAISDGSACTSQVMEPSHVLSAMYHGTERANSSIRFSFGRFEELFNVKNIIISISERLKLSHLPI